MTARTGTGKRRRKTTIEEDIPDGQGTGDETSEFDVSLEGVEDTETLNNVLEQFGQTNNVLYRIYRQTPTGPSFCFESPTFDEAFLQRERGAGAYSVRIFINNKFKKTIGIQVDAPQNPGNGNGHATTGDPHAQFLEKLLMLLLTRESNGGGNHAPSLTDMTAALANLDALRGKQESGMEMFLKGAEFFKAMGGGGEGGPLDWKSELLKMGRDALPAITSIVQARTGQIPPNPQTPPVQPQGEQPVVIDPNTLTPEQRSMLLKQAIQYLKQQFMMGVDAESALTFIVANRVNPQYQPIIQAILAMTWEEIEALDNDLKNGQPFHAQFRTLFDGLRYEFTEQDSMDEPAGVGNSGNDANPGNNGETGTGRKQ